MSQQAHETHVALLRGINVGGHHKLPMADLRALAESLGCREVRSYIQSGNLIFRPPEDGLAGLDERIADAIEADFDFRVPVVLRSRSEIEGVAERSPYRDLDGDPRFVLIGFFDREPEADRVAELDPEVSPGDRFEVLGREVHVHCPEGTARSKLTYTWFERQLGVTATFRNWRTLLKVQGMMEDDG